MLSLNIRPALINSLLLVVVVSLTLVTTNVLAVSKPLLFPLPDQTIFPSQEFTYLLVPSVDYEPTYAVRLVNAPLGATLTKRPDGISEFRWVPPTNVGTKTIVLVQVFDTANSALKSTQRMVLQRGKVVPKEQSVSDEIVPPEEKPVESSQVQATVSEIASAAALETELDITPTSQTRRNRSPSLPEIGQQFLQVGAEFQLFVKPSDPDGDEVDLLVNSLPAGAEFRQVFGRSQVLSWRPSASQVGDHIIVLSAIDKQDVTLRSDRVVVLHVLSEGENENAAAAFRQSIATSAMSPSGSHSLAHVDNLAVVVDLETPPQISAASSVAPAMPVAPPEPVEYNAELESSNLGNDALYIEPISSQIVSIGRVVRFPVVPQTSNNVKAILHVDRLPENASFDENSDGSRTFYWKTTSADQGTHTFRFTAIHPDDINVRVITEALVIVGDPGLIGAAAK